MDEGNNNNFEIPDQDEQHAFAFISVRAPWFHRLRFIARMLWSALVLLKPSADGGVIVARFTAKPKQ